VVELGLGEGEGHPVVGEKEDEGPVGLAGGLERLEHHAGAIVGTAD